MTGLAMELNLKDQGCQPLAKLVLFYIADAHNRETGECFPSFKHLASKTGLGRATVIRHVEALEEAGLISRVERARGNGSQASNGYVLHFGESQNDTPGVSQRDPLPVPQRDSLPVPQRDPPNHGSTNLGSTNHVGRTGKFPMHESWGLNEEDYNYAHRKKLLPGEIMDLFEEFKAYWMERGDKHGRKSDRGWHQTWRNRVNDRYGTIIKNRELARRHDPSSGQSASGFAGAAMRRQAGREIDHPIPPFDGPTRRGEEC